MSIVFARPLYRPRCRLPTPAPAGGFNLSPFGRFRYENDPGWQLPLCRPLDSTDGDVLAMSQARQANPPLQSIVVIPARYASTRLPRKMLLRETGKSLLQHTYEAARQAKRPAAVVIATDHAEIAPDVRRFGGEFV